LQTATIEQAWERYATSGRTPRRAQNAAGQHTWFNWTSHQDHGPNEAVLGPLAGRSVLELGSGTGCNLAHLATRGAHCTGLDVSPTQTAKARDRWGHLPDLKFFADEVVEFLDFAAGTFDVIYSVFGAHWFTDPDVLLPLVRKRLVAGGVYAFSHTAPADIAPLGPKAVITRYDLPAADWTAALQRHGFRDVHAQLVQPPAVGGHHTLLVHAHA
jgi:SAM-dependent methyltransferase